MTRDRCLVHGHTRSMAPNRHPYNLPASTYSIDDTRHLPKLNVCRFMVSEPFLSSEAARFGENFIFAIPVTTNKNLLQSLSQLYPRSSDIKAPQSGIVVHIGGFLWETEQSEECSDPSQAFRTTRDAVTGHYAPTERPMTVGDLSVISQRSQITQMLTLFVRSPSSPRRSSCNC
jgi:hypothetical protein